MRLADGLSLRDHRPQSVRRVHIPKSDGRMRPLGNPTIRERALQMLAKMALEPEWETRFETNSCASSSHNKYRINHCQIRQIKKRRGLAV